MLVNGHGDELLYERAMIATDLPLAELRKQCEINTRAHSADKSEDFSQSYARHCLIHAYES